MKHQQILNAATDLFLRLGFGSVSMDTVANEANVSKATVYAHFSSKNELFSAILKNYLTRENILPPELPSNAAQNNIELDQDLLIFLTDLAKYYNNPAVIKLYRLLISEVNKFPEIFEWVFGTKAEQTTQRLADYLLQSLPQIKAQPQAFYLLSCKILDMLRGVTLWGNLVKNPNKHDLYNNQQNLAKDIHQAATCLINDFLQLDNN